MYCLERAVVSQPNNPTFTRTVSISGTLACPQLTPHPSQNNFYTIKASGLYHYDIGAPLQNAPYPAAWNIRTIEIGREARYSQIAMAGDTDEMFLRRQTNNDQGVNYFTQSKEVVHSGNINTFTQPALGALALNAPLASPTFAGFFSVNGTLACPQLSPHPSQNNLDTHNTRAVSL